MPKSKNNLKVVSIFSGAGCFDLGFEVAGFNTILAVDSDFDCCSTIKANRNWLVVNSPIEALKSKDLLGMVNLKPRQLDLLIGGPPCQPFSKSAFGSVANLLGFEDERALTVREYMRIVRTFLPNCFVIENVPQFITGKNLATKEYLENAMKRINIFHGTNYKLSYCKINTAWYGVPQLRERLFIIGSRSGKLFKMPNQIFFKNYKENKLLSYRTTWDAIGHLETSFRNDTSLKVGGKWGDLLPSVPPGNNYLWHTRRGGGKNIFEWRSRYWNFLLKLHPQQPSWTIAANPGQHTGPFHWGNRRLSIKELQLLQTIPAEYKFCGSAISARRQIGNAVPSAIGELIGKEIRKQIFGERSIELDKLELIPKKRKRKKVEDEFLVTAG